MVATTMLVDSEPVGLAFNQYNGLLYMANNKGKSIFAIATPTITYSGESNGTIDIAGLTAICDITNTYGKP